jgi:hypothetical protein
MISFARSPDRAVSRATKGRHRLVQLQKDRERYGKETRLGELQSETGVDRHWVAVLAVQLAILRLASGKLGIPAGTVAPEGTGI